MKSAMPLLISVVVTVGLLTGCTPSANSAVSDCEVAFTSLAPLVPVDGLDLLISEQFASTLETCASVDQWLLQLSRHPSSAGEREIDRARALEYLAASCQLLADASRQSSVCLQAESDGQFVPR